MSMIRNSAIVILTFVFPCYGQLTESLSEQTPRFIANRMVNPEDAGMSSEALQEIGRFLREHVRRRELGGAVVLVAKEGKVVCLEAVGMRSREEKIPLNFDTLFRIHSMTKPIVSAAVMTLYEEGRFNLDDPVAKWLPEFRQMKVVTDESSDAEDSGYVTEPARNRITIRHLLTHTAGFPQDTDERPRKDWVSSDAYQLRHRLRPYGTLKQMTTSIAELALDFHPGEAFDYGPSTDVVGRFAEVVSGKQLHDLVATRILQPLGMKDTKFFISAEKAELLCGIYRVGPAGTLGLVEDATTRWNIGEDKTYFSAQGGLVSTVEDYFRFLLMIRNQGTFNGNRILKAETVRLMTQDHLAKMDLPPEKGFGFGLGFGVLTLADHLQRDGAVFWLGTGGSRFLLDPEDDVMYILLMQKRGGPNVRKRIDVIVHNALQRRP